jgi:galactoside 2-L-fucosyltransferase 1/2
VRQADADILMDAIAAGSECKLPLVKPNIVLLGIFSNAFTFEQDRGVREAYRTSIAVSKRKGFEFVLKHWFFVGKEADTATENATYADILQGSFQENMNEGKTFEWFSAASRMDVDFVIKMDQDTSVRWSALLLLASLKSPVYFGTRIVGWGVVPWLSSPVSYASVPSNECLDFTGSCWFYMSGGFYGVSIDVARVIASCPFAQAARNGPEDAVFGYCVYKCMPSVRIADIPIGVVHRHYNMDKGDMESKILGELVNQARQPHTFFQSDPVKASLHGTVAVRFAGRLGNQLFQAASSYGIAVARESLWCLPDLPGSILEESVVFHVQPVQCPTVNLSRVNENGNHLEFHSSIMEGTDDALVGDYLQSYRYFSLSGIPFELRSRASGQEWVAQRGIRVGIHVRRTDQIGHGHGGRDPGVGYYETALAMLRKTLDGNFTVVVCTDDPQWVRAQRIFDGMYIRDGTDPPFVDMGILAACRHMIMSIGTFGWWAAYLRPEIGETFYYAEPFMREMNYDEHFLNFWTAISDQDIASHNSTIAAL